MVITIVKFIWHNVGYVNIFQLADAVDETSFNTVIAGSEWR
jgi:hypothetical protein